MFTGIVTDKGRVRSIEKKGDTRIVIGTAFTAETIDIGASIACSGACLTVVDKGNDKDGNWFAVDVSEETLSKTSFGDWKEGAAVNLERSLKLGDEMGGHIVLGHVDGVALVDSVTPEGDSVRFVFKAPAPLVPYIAPKGSITLDGVSLTVNDVEGDTFGVNVIPHTLEVTTFGEATKGQKVNLEIDVLARYVARLKEAAA